MYRQQLRAGQRSSAERVSDRVLFGRVLRTDRVCAGANHAKGLRMQFPVWTGNTRYAQEGDRRSVGHEVRVEVGSVLLQEQW